MEKRAAVKLKKGSGKTLKSGGLWVYDNEIAQVTGEFENGALVDVLDFDEYFLGVGFINTASKIRIRVLTRLNQEIDEEFFYQRIKKAWEYRKKTVDTSSCRLIFGEADFLPGFVVDKFSDILVVQSLALGIDRWKDTILNLLLKVLQEDKIFIRGIYERSDAKVRLQEGMERTKGFLSEPFDTKVEIMENNVRYFVDVAEGQKTGFFLDQKYNRAAVKALASGMKVLDCFTHTGSFALNAALGGASSVLGVDVSELGIRQAIRNAELNHMEDKVKFLCASVFELLPKLEEEGEVFDFIILDPPNPVFCPSSISTS